MTGGHPDATPRPVGVGVVKVDDTELAWAAGIFEGEGMVQIAKTKKEGVFI